LGLAYLFLSDLSFSPLFRRGRECHTKIENRERRRMEKERERAAGRAQYTCCRGLGLAKQLPR
jgi:hypothetical protein